MKKRVTLTIDKDVLKKVDETIDGSLVKNRSHAFEILVSKSLGTSKLSKALILAGGQTNEDSEDKNIPQSMMKYNGKPILQYNIELLKNYGINNIMISIGQNGGLIKKYFSDGQSMGVKITYVQEKNPLGTAGPLNLAKKYFNESFILMNADEIKDINLTDMFSFHKENEGYITIALTTVKDPSKYGVAVMNGHKINSFIEKPGRDNIPSSLINAGLYIMEPEVIDLVPEGYASLEHDVFPKLAKKDKLHGYPFAGKWFDSSGIQGKYKISVKQFENLEPQ